MEFGHWHSRAWQGVVVAIVVLAGWLALAAASASADGDIYERSGGCNPAPCDDNDLVYAGDGANNIILIQRLSGPSGAYYDFLDIGGGEITGFYSICSRVSPEEVTCPTTWDYGDEVATFDVDAELHDGTDTVDMRTTRPSRIEGGAGSDVLKGGSSNDTILGDSDFFSGQPDGNDFIDGRGGADSMHGDGGGGDTVSYASRSTATFDSIDGVANDGGGGEGDNIATDVENLSGSQGNDFLTGNGSPNQLFGNGGNNTLQGMGNNDTLQGGDGIDDLQGGDGNDSLTGGIGQDTLRGGNDNDSMGGGADGDTFIGGPGADDMNGGAGTDSADYSASVAPLSVTADDGANDGAAGEGDNVHSDIEILHGGQANDTLVPKTDDTVPGEVWGGPGNDTLFGGGQASNDRLEGEDGDDTLDGRWGADIMNGGPGIDTVDYRGHEADPGDGSLTGVNSIPDGIGNDGNGYIDANFGGPGPSHDNVGSDIENVIGSEGPDNILGTVAPNRLEGRGENDVISGDASSDTLLGGAGSDALHGDAGNDAIDGGGGADTMDGGADIDLATYATRTADVVVGIGGGADDGEVGEGDNVNATIENVRTGSGDDVLRGSAADNSLIGGPGSDNLNGRLGADILNGQAGVDTITYADRVAPVAVSLDGKANDGADPNADGRSTAAEEGDTDVAVENAFGGTDDDILRAPTANGVANLLRGLAGDDRLNAREGTATVDTLDCGGGTADRFAKDPSDAEIGCEIALP
jgi:Ca2+-binding RTX toxin-like protein